MAAQTAQPHHSHRPMQNGSDSPTQALEKQHKEQQKREQRVVAGLSWLLNVGSSVSIIITNKAILSAYDFPFATTLTGMHFATTSLLGLLWGPRKESAAAAAGEAGAGSGGSTLARRQMWWELVLFSIVADVSIAAMNFSLMLNTVGFYQISKLCVLPCVSLLEAVFYAKHFTPLLRLSVLMVTLGVAICTVTDVSINATGAAVALLAVLCTSAQQVLIGALQRKHSMTSVQLLSYTSPIQAALLLLFGPVCDRTLTSRSIFAYPFTPYAVAWIALSCVLALLCNLSQYLCLGRFSATSFQVLGQMKTILVLFSGWLLYDTTLSWANALGMLVAMSGMSLYSFLAHRHKQAREHPKPKSS